MESYSFFYSTQKILISGKDFKEFSKTVSHARRVEIKKLHVVVELDFNPDELIKLVDTYHGLVNVKITILPLVHSHSTFRRQTHTYDDKGKIDKTAMVEFKRDKEECGAEALVAMLGAVIQKHRPSDQNLDLFANMGSESRVAEYDAGMKGMKSEEREETERKGG